MPEKGHFGVAPDRGAGAAPKGRGTAPQDGRSRAVPSRVGSYALSAGGRCSGQYAAVRAWDGLAARLSELLEWSESSEGKATMDAHGHISVRRFMAVAQAEGETADARTRREVTTSHETAALRATEILGRRVSRGVAIRARRVMEAAGFSVTAAEGLLPVRSRAPGGAGSARPGAAASGFGAGAHAPDEASTFLACG